MQRVTQALLFLVFSFSFTACAPPHTGERLHLGAIFPVTGPLAEVGAAQLEAAHLAADEINAAGGVLGRELEIRFRNDGSDPDNAQRFADELVAGGATVLIGGVDSTIARHIEQATGGRAVFLSGSATATGLTAQGEGFTFRTCATEAGEATLLAQRARARAITRVAVIRKQESDGTLVETFASAFTRGGGTITLTASYQAGERSYRELLAQVLGSGPEAILLDADPVDGAQIVRDYVLTASGSGVGWLFTHSVEIPSFLVAVGAHNFSFPHEGVGPGTPTGSRYGHFAAGYEKKFGAAPAVGAFTANVYDAVFLAALALEQAGTSEPGAVRDALRPVSLGGTAYGPADFRRLVEALGQHQDVNYEGASGSVDLDLQGDTSAPYDVWVASPSGFSVVERAVRPID
ncbi:MAG: ABC transporter substrate-binding protein [Myxococcaceae bacterium]